MDVIQTMNPSMEHYTCPEGIQENFRESRWSSRQERLHCELLFQVEISVLIDLIDNLLYCPRGAKYPISSNYS